MPSTKSPFKFLDSYEKDDKNIFFGRDMETAELYDRLFETNLVLLYGASGTGKTSLINCGLANQFESSDWYPVFIRRKEHVLKSLRRELDKHAQKKMPETATLIECVRSLYLDYFKPIFLVFDQFEEIFILGEKQEQLDFFHELQRLLEANLQCKVILSMREEYIAHLSEFEAIVPTLFDNRIRIEKMNMRNLREVVTKTAEELHIQLDDEQKVVDLILEKLRDKNHEIDLANLQVYLDRLYRIDDDRRKHENRSDVLFDDKLIDQTGNLDDVMSLFLDEQLDVLEQELATMKGVTQKGIPLDILFELVTDNGTKRAVDIKEITEQLKHAKKIPEDVVRYCIDRFKEMRIIRELSE